MVHEPPTAAPRGSPCREGSCQRTLAIALGALADCWRLSSPVVIGASKRRWDADIRAINDRLIAGNYREAEGLAAAAHDLCSVPVGAESVELARLEDSSSLP